MHEVILRNGPLEGQRVRLSHDTSQYSERLAGKRVVYRDSGETDPPTGLPTFAFHEAVDMARRWDFADA